MQNDKLKKTPLHRCHLQLGARLVPFAGYEMPVQYSGVLEESKAVRSRCGLFDVSHMGQFSLYGKDALAELYRLVTNDLLRLQLGQAQYNMLCNEKGGTLDDLVVYYRGEEHLFLCVNASNREKDFEWIRSHLNPKVSLVDESDEIALLALQGPKAQELLSTLSDPTGVEALRYYWGVETKVGGITCFLSRTGYTGEDGFEIYVATERASSLWELLLEKGRKVGLIPIGLGARDTLRLEMGYALYGHELDEKTSPLCAGLGWTVKLSREMPFIGQDSLKREHELGSPLTLRALVMQDRRIARQAYRIFDSKGSVGVITSGTHSPHVGAPIALGFVEKGACDTLFVEVRETLIPAKVVKLPFVESKTKKTIS